MDGDVLGVSRKRLRDAAMATASPAVLRDDLADRISRAAPPFWRDAASAAGLAGADAFLVRLGQSITVALQSVTESAEAARALLRETRSALHEALDARCEELRVSIDAAEERKAGALERELVAVDFALELWRAESTAVREALTSSTDTVLELEHVALTSRLDELTALLSTLPDNVVEPPLVGLSLQPSNMSIGHVLAPLPISAADLMLEAVPRSVLAGGSLCLRLSLGTRHDGQSVEELQTSLVTLAGSIRVCAELELLRRS